MITLDEIKADKYTRKAFAYYIHRVLCCYNGMQEAYTRLTKEIIDDEEKTAVWDTYTRAFDDRIMQDIMAVMEKHKLGMADSAIAVMKLLELVGDSIDKFEEGKQTDEYWQEKFQ